MYLNKQIYTILLSLDSDTYRSMPIIKKSYISAVAIYLSTTSKNRIIRCSNWDQVKTYSNSVHITPWLLRVSVFDKMSKVPFSSYFYKPWGLSGFLHSVEVEVVNEHWWDLYDALSSCPSFCFPPFFAPSLLLSLKHLLCSESKRWECVGWGDEVCIIHSEERTLGDSAVQMNSLLLRSAAVSPAIVPKLRTCCACRWSVSTVSVSLILVMKWNWAQGKWGTWQVNRRELGETWDSDFHFHIPSVPP